MSHYAVFNNTEFRLADGDASLSAIDALIDEHMDGYPITIEVGTDGKYVLDFSGGDVGDSFNGLVSKLINAMTPHVLDAFEVKITNIDSASDDNSQIIFGGPNEAAISAYKRDHYTNEALDLLRSNAPDAHALLQGALAAGGGATAIPKIVITVEGGVVQGVMSDVPVEIYSVDYETDGTDAKHLLAIRQSDNTTEPAICSKKPAEINIRRVAEISALISKMVTGEELRNAANHMPENHNSINGVGTPKLRIFEVTAAGFDSSSDETDDLVFWIAAESCDQVEFAIKDTGATFCHEVQGMSIANADFTLPGQTMLLSSALLEKASECRNRNRPVA